MAFTNNKELAEKMQSERIYSIKKMVGWGMRRADAEDIFHDAVTDFLTMDDARREGVETFEAFLHGALKNKKNSFFRKPKYALMYVGEDSGARMTYNPAKTWIDDEVENNVFGYSSGEGDAYEDCNDEDDAFDGCSGEDDALNDCNGEDDTLGNVVDEVFDDEDFVVRKKIIDDLLKDLKPIERKLIHCLYYNENKKKMPFKEIARELGFKNAAVVSTTKKRLLDLLKVKASQVLKKYNAKMRIAS